MTNDTNAAALFDFGIVKARPVRPGTVIATHWTWSLLFRDCPGRIFHITRRSGALREWK